MQAISEIYTCQDYIFLIAKHQIHKQFKVPSLYDRYEYSLT